MWFRVGFIGASGVLIGLSQLFGGEMKPLSALALALGSAAMVAVTWWRVRSRLEDLEVLAASGAGIATPAFARPTADDPAIGPKRGLRQAALAHRVSIVPGFVSAQTSRRHIDERAEQRVALAGGRIDEPQFRRDLGAGPDHAVPGVDRIG